MGRQGCTNRRKGGVRLAFVLLLACGTLRGQNVAPVQSGAATATTATPAETTGTGAQTTAGASSVAAGTGGQAAAGTDSQTAAGTGAQAAAGTGAQTIAGGILRGTVKAGAVPLPGVSVTAANTLTGKKYTTTTDLRGGFSMSIPKNGRYVLKAELAGFAPVTHEALLNASSHEQQVEFALRLASREAEQEAVQTARAGAASSLRGTQSLSVLAGDADATQAGMGASNTGASLPSIAGGTGGGTLGEDAATDSVAVSGQMGSVNPLAGVSEDDIRQRIQDMRADMRAQGGNLGDLFGGGPGGPGGGGPGGGRGGPGGGRGFGGGGGPGGNFSVAFRKFNPAQPHGAIFYVGGNSAVNAQDFSLTGAPVGNPSYNTNTFGATFSLTPIIPHVLTSTKNFVFFNLTGVKNANLFDEYGTVPTPLERTGNLSALLGPAGTPVTIYDPVSGQQFSYNGQLNAMDPARISSQAQALLNYYPAPNLPGTLHNYHRLTTAGLNTTNINTRFIHNFGGGGGGGGMASFLPFLRQQGDQKSLRQNLNIGLNYSRTASDALNIFPALDGKDMTHNYALNLGYTIGYGRLTNNLALNWNRSHSTAVNLFTDKTNVAAASGIQVGDGSTSANPFNYGVPGVSFATFTGIADTPPSDAIGQTISFTELTNWSYKKHNMRYGGSFRRIHADTYGGSNVFGGFTFTGYATREPGSAVSAGTQSTGSDFADYLLGLPQRSTVQASNYKHYLRANAWALFAQDDWRMTPKLTLNYGLRYEYFSPYAEKYDRLANLDYNANFTAVAEVFPNGIGAVTGQKFPHTLLRPDRSMWAPRFGFAWRVAKDTVLRGGYGINYNTGQYATMGRQFANQPPFAVTQTNIVGQQGCGVLEIANAFNCTGISGTGTSGSGALIQNNFAANPNYRLGYIQVYNLDLQRTIPGNIVLNVDYNGSHGNSLDDRYAPNVGINSNGIAGVGISNAQSFTFADSLAFSNFNALLISARRRLHNGVALSAQYQYSHAIDNASSVGGGAGVVAQNPRDLLAEEGNSSFDIRHQVSGNWVYELPFGPKAMFLTSGNVFSRAAEGLSVSGIFDFASGTPLTPSYAASIAEVSRGTTGSLRPDRVPGAPLAGGGGSLLRWFNTSAFSAPVVSPSNPFGYGTASRNSIPGPGTVSVNASLSKTESLGETRSLEFRATANNVFNTVQYSGVDTTIGSATYGQVTSVATMRRLTFYARFRF